MTAVKEVCIIPRWCLIDFVGEGICHEEFFEIGGGEFGKRQ
jgi:hypothetical protein